MTVAGSAASLTKAINDTVKELAVTQASMNTKVTAIQANQATAATQKTTAEGYRDTAATNATSAAASLATVKSTVVMDGIPAVSGSKMGTAVDTFIYDTSLDSDGGAWRKRCQHTSWFNETITGKWLGAQPSETYARYEGATLGAELVTNNEFNNGITGWTTANSGVATASGGIATFNSASVPYPSFVSPGFATTVGKLYRIRVRAKKISGNSTYMAIGTGAGFSGGATIGSEILITSDFVDYTMFSTATAATMYAGLFGGLNPATGIIQVDSISVREVTALTTSSNDYFQLTTDGKFYRLWNNTFTWSDQFDNAAWRHNSYTTNLTITPNAVGNPVVGALSGADLLVPTTTSAGHGIQHLAISGGAYVEVVAKASGYSCIAITDGGNNFTVRFDLTGSGTTVTESGSPTEVSILALSDGWYRCRLRLPNTVQGGQFRIYVRQSISGGAWASYAGDGTSGVLLAAAQQSVGSFVSTYEAKAAEGSVSEVFRGNRREFPAVALIVAEAAKVTIYDADDLTLPMWMVFVAGQTGSADFNWMLHPSGTISSVTCLNGTFCVGRTGTWARFIFFNFLVEKCQAYGGNGVSLLMNGPVSKRNSALGASQFGAMIANDNINDIAMTVLPNAPIDAATGLPVPTIAVATNGGISIIKQDGTIGNSDYTGTFNNVQFTKDFSIWGRFGGYNLVQPLSVWSGSSPWSTFGGNNYWDGTNQFPLNTDATGQIATWQGGEAIGTPGAAAVKPGLQMVRRGKVLRTETMAAKVTASFNTGWFVGDTRGIFLASKDTTSMVGSDLRTSTVNTILGSWTESGGVVTMGGAAGSDSVSFNLSTATTLGKQYIVTVAGSISGGSYYVDFGPGTGASQIGNLGSVGVFYVTANNVSSLIRVGRWTGAPVGTLEVTTVELTDADRSVNNKGLLTRGTVTRTSVATGAELVGYAGFTGSNYLEQPYNSALDFGTGDFCVMTWGTEFGTWRSIFSRVDSSTNAPLLVLEPSGTTNQARVFINSVQYIANFPWFSGTWRHIAMVRISGVISLYLDGVLQSSFAAAGTVNGTLPSFKIAKHSSVQGSGAYSQGSLALFGIGATAPTADQIKRIYEDELRMFQPGAACTLYGTSDAVTGLAYDPKTNLLHAGTSSGRSVFDGLVRVANTTTPVTTAISAVNGLIAEQ